MVKMGEWDFPERQQTFNPEDTIFKDVYKDQVALIAYAQYRRKHIVSKEENEWLPFFAIHFATDIRTQKSLNEIRRGEKTVTLDEAVKIWLEWWIHNPRGIAGDECEDKWRAVLDPILPFINGERALELTFDRGKFWLVTREGRFYQGLYRVMVIKKTPKVFFCQTLEPFTITRDSGDLPAPTKDLERIKLFLKKGTEFTCVPILLWRKPRSRRKK